MNKISAAVAAGCILLGSVAAPANSAFAQVTLKLGHAIEPESIVHKTSEEFSRLVAEKTQDEVTVDVYPSSQLGGHEEMMQKLRLGTLDLSPQATVASQYIPELALFEMPYLVKDMDHMRRIEKEIIWPKLGPAIEEKGFKLVGIWNQGGPRHITNNSRPIHEPADLEGIKLRVPGSEWRVKMFQAYGANPTPMAFTEMFTALQTGVIDGQENPLANIASSHLNEVQDYLSLSGHVYTPIYLLAGLSKWNSLPEETRTALMEAAAESEEFAYDLQAESEGKLLLQLKDAGMQVNEVNKDAFIEMSDPIYDAFAEQVKGGRALVDEAIRLGKEN